MMGRLALRNFAERPGRTAFLLGGYGIGVGVMIVLLSIGEALLSQARDERLIGGGDITVLPEGIDIELLKTGGVGGMFFSVSHARFLYLQHLASPRLAPWVEAVAPQIEGKLAYLTSGGRTYPVRATGEIPSRTMAVGALPELASGTWEDDELDRRWIAPSPAELYADIDAFHLPPPELAHPRSWAEWHYFNVISEDRLRWAFITLMVGGDIPEGRWGGRVLITIHEQGRPERRFVADAEPHDVSFSTRHPDVRIGESSVRLLPDGRYDVRARAREEGGGAEAEVDLIVRPEPRANFPGTSLGGGSGEFVSGYVVPALRAYASGRVCVAGRCEVLSSVPSYHDHNWGTWAGVTWDWGIARAGEFSVLWGQVQPPDTLAATAPLFVYVVDSLGFLGIFRPRSIAYEDARVLRTGGRTILVPSRATLFDIRGADTLRLELETEDASATPVGEGPGITNGGGPPRPWFIQLKGVARLTGRVGGVPLSGEGITFFETHRAAAPAPSF